MSISFRRASGYCALSYVALTVICDSTVIFGQSSTVSSPPREEAVELGAFEVRADSDQSYGALNSNSVTRFNAELSRLPVSADIFTETFMKDVGINTIEDLIMTYSAGAGFDTDNAATVGNTQPGDRNANSNIKLRGLTTAVMSRDGFVSMSGGAQGTNISSTFDAERVEIINGPQALLYGNGGAGGVINVVSKQARFNRKPIGSLQLKVDKFGHEGVQLDYGASYGRVAVRLAAVHEKVATGRRDFLGGPMDGVYLQVAARAGNTVFRLSGGYTDFDRIFQEGILTVTAPTVASDTRSGMYLTYLLATNQLERASNGASGMGFIGNGHINWDNVNSYEGWRRFEKSIGKMSTLSAETKWNHWLSTEVAAGYREWGARTNFTSGSTLYPANHPNNPTGEWAHTMATGVQEPVTYRENRTKALRFSALIKNDLFNGRVKSQTIVGGDYGRTDAGVTQSVYYQADSNWNLIVNQANVANIEMGRIPLGASVAQRMIWGINNGPTKYPFWRPFTPRVTYNGQNYVLTPRNTVSPDRVSAQNPLGVARLGGGTYSEEDTVNRGIYIANTLTLLDGKIETLTGARIGESYRLFLNQGVANANFEGSHQAHKLLREDSTNYNVGVNFALRPWLRPYISFSDSNNPPTGTANDPHGNPPESAHGVGREVGVKLTNATNTLSGSIAFYDVSSKNEQLQIASTLVGGAVNPAGLNGQFRSPSVWINVDREARGVQVAVTASPTRNWRMRFSGAHTTGKLGSSKSYAQLYNDQFHQNAQGQVTYADGSTVYVLPRYVAATAVVTPDTPGAIPLTLSMMNDPASPYYANPNVVTGHINTGSNVANVLRRVDPQRGTILTGATGLPISALQITPTTPLPGTVDVALAGDSTVGYPEYTFNFTSMYSFTQGRLKGLRLGGTVLRSWSLRQYYYYTGPVAPGADRKLFERPDLTQVNAMVGFSWKLARFPMSTQLNITNLFNRYNVVILPHPLTGYNSGMNATFDAQPRSFLLMNTLSF